MEDGLVLSQSEYEYLLEEIYKLQARITELTALRDDLVYHVCPALQAEYDEKIVSLERELMAANMYLRELQRTIEILQAQMNQRQEPSMEEAQAQAKQENKKFEDDLNRKAEEAREFKKKWEESGWSKHDREEREAKEKEKDKSNDNPGGKASGESGQSNGESDHDQKGPDADHTGAGSGQRDGGSGNDPGDDNGAGSGDAGKDTDQNGKDGSTSEGSGKKDDGGSEGRNNLPENQTPLQEDRETSASGCTPKCYGTRKRLAEPGYESFSGDLGKLEKIWDELSGMDAPEDVFDDTPEGRKKLRELLEKLKVRMQMLELEIDHIRTEFPYKIKSFLEDPAAVEEVRRGILSKIDNVREMNRQLEAFINELKEKLRKGEKL